MKTSRRDAMKAMAALPFGGVAIHEADASERDDPGDDSTPPILQVLDRRAENDQEMVVSMTHPHSEAINDRIDAAQELGRFLDRPDRDMVIHVANEGEEPRKMRSLVARPPIKPTTHIITHEYPPLIPKSLVSFFDAWARPSIFGRWESVLIETNPYDSDSHHTDHHFFTTDT